MSPVVCFSRYDLEGQAVFIIAVTIFVYLVVHGVWKALDKKYRRGSK